MSYSFIVTYPKVFTHIMEEVKEEVKGKLELLSNG